MSTLRAYIAGSIIFLTSNVVFAAGPSVPIAFFYDWDTDTNFYTVTPEEMGRFEPVVPYQGWYRYDNLPSTRSMYGSLRAWASADTAQPDAVPVCRFYWPSQVLHFYTAFAFECDKLIKSPGPWILENAAAFYVLLPEAATGACPADSAPIYRLQVSSDHLFISSLADRNRILATGQEITPEGFGPLGVAFCSPVD